ncbi:unnamed protein product [Nesidiocoris tenuis]|uniref:Uncharacterized protein n=1 Tax=Nesidiocoris tenuis TaxID=355587 RepID=A0A6H5H6V9_9HEMI|nr:unnamed protein product [Nesidiocoris tenuis]
MSRHRDEKMKVLRAMSLTVKTFALRSVRSTSTRKRPCASHDFAQLTHLHTIRYSTCWYTSQLMFTSNQDDISITFTRCVRDKNMASEQLRQCCTHLRDSASLQTRPKFTILSPRIDFDFLGGHLGKQSKRLRFRMLQKTQPEVNTRVHTWNACVILEN